MEALNEYTAAAIENGEAKMVVPQIRARHEREAVAMAVNIMSSEGVGCRPDTEIAISEIFSQHTFSATVAEWTTTPD